MLDSVVFVVNREATRHFDRLEAHCGEAAVARGFRPVFFDRPQADFASANDRITALAECIADREAHLVLAVGGDGTVRLCARAILQHHAILGIIPRGAANLVAHALELPQGLDAALRVALTGTERVVDLATVNDQICVAMAGMGSDARVVSGTSTFLKRRLGWLGYAVVALPHLHRAPHEFEIRLDGGQPMQRRAHSVVIGNVGILPGGFTLLAGAELDDGFLDVGVLAPDGVIGWAQLGVHLVARQLELTDSPDHQASDEGSAPLDALEHYRAKYVEISSELPMACQIDGETIGSGQSLVAGVREQVLVVRVAAG